MTSVEAPPDFIGLGAQRCATTWTYNCLREHPEVAFPLGKEAHLFDRERIDSGQLLRYLRAFGGEGAAGEITPEYLWMAKAPRRIAEHVPSASLFAILRNPIDRAYSQYALDRRNGDVDGPFTRAIEEKSEYIDRGFYGRQLERYLNLFDRDQMRIFLYAGLKERPAVFLDKLFSFLGVETGFRPNAMDRRANRGQYASAEVTAAMLHLVDRLRAYPLTRQGVDFLKRTRVGRTLARRIFDSGEQGVDPAVRWELWDCFREDVALLEQVTGRSDLTARWAPGDGAPAR